MNLATALALPIFALSSVVTLQAVDPTESDTPKLPVENDRPVTLAPPETAEHALLQGKWEGVEVGKEANGKCTMMVTGNKMEFQGWRKEEWYKAAFSLPPRTEPKQLRGSILECPIPEMVGKTSPGIYKLENGKLTVAAFRPGSAEVPTSFELVPGVRIFEFTKAVEPAK